MPATQTRRKQRVGEALAALRERAGRTTTEAAELLQRSQSLVSKWENGILLCAFAELTALLVYYNATEQEHAEIVNYWHMAKQSSKRIEGASAVPQKFRAFLRSEVEASSVRELQPCAVPGLLQTGPYSVAVHKAAERIIDPLVGGERATVARLARQKLLHGPHPLMLHVLMDHGVIRRVVGDSAITSQQLRHLLAIGEQDNVTIQIIHEDAGAYGTMSGPLTIHGFLEPPDSAYVEYQGGGEWIDAKEDVRKYSEMFTDIAAMALSTAESAALIRARAVELEGRNDQDKISGTVARK